MNANRVSTTIRHSRIALAVGIVALVLTGLAVTQAIPHSQAEEHPHQSLAEESAAVTFNEYDIAFHAYMECLAGVGWQLVEPAKLTARNEYDFQVFRPGSDPNASDAERSSWQQQRENCRRINFDQIQAVWALKNAMSDDERQQARDALGACLRGGGYDVPLHPLTADWERFARVQPGVTDPAATRAFLACAKGTAAAFGLRTGEVP